jgi:hypothetical protein
MIETVMRNKQHEKELQRGSYPQIIVLQHKWIIELAYRLTACFLHVSLSAHNHHVMLLPRMI